MSRAPAVLGVGGAVAGVLLAAVVLQARARHFPEPPFADRLLYLRSGAVADRVVLQFDAVVADIYWIRAIQHFGRDRRSSRPDRFALLQPLLDLTTTLDPHFNIAYRFGAIFLALDPPDGAGRPDQATALLHKGLAASPARWQFAHDLGFVHYWFARDPIEAARWFERAAAMPGAPEWIGPLAAVTRIQGGDRAGARRLLTELAASTETYVRQAAERGLQQIQALDAIDELEGLVEEARTRTGTAPSRWADVFPAQPGLTPLDPTGVSFVLDAATGRVTLAPTSTLHPLPRFPEAR